MYLDSQTLPASEMILLHHQNQYKAAEKADKLKGKGFLAVTQPRPSSFLSDLFLSTAHQ